MSFQLDPIWPPMFESRLASYDDPLSMMPKGGERNRCHAPTQKSVETISKATGGHAYTGVGTMYKIRPGSRVELVRNYLLRNPGPKSSQELAGLCGCASKRLLESLAMAVECGVFNRRKTRGVTVFWLPEGSVQ